MSVSDRSIRVREVVTPLTHSDDARGGAVTCPLPSPPPRSVCVRVSLQTPLARLTYAWYLLHPMWMNLLYDSSQSGLVYYDLLGTSYYLANCVMGLMCALAAFFLVEAPFLNLKILLLPKAFALCHRARRG
jgi:peptidoglycan/LPS O-acetylase OafA/YrhL